MCQNMIFRQNHRVPYEHNSMHNSHIEFSNRVIDFQFLGDNDVSIEISKPSFPTSLFV